MRKFVSLLSMMTFTAFYVSAQNQPSPDFYWSLVKNNAQSIGLNNDDLKNVRISDAYYDSQSKAYLVYLQQTYKSVDVENVISALAFKDDKLITGRFIKNSAIETVANNMNAKATLGAVDAMLKAATVTGVVNNNKFMIPIKQSADARHFEFAKFDGLMNNVHVDLRWVSADDNNNFKLSWNVFMHTTANNAAWMISVDATSGQIIKQKNLTVYETNGTVNRPHELYVYEDNDAEQNQAVDNVESVKSISSANYSVIPYPVESPVLKAGVPTLVNNPWTAFPNTNATTLKWNSDGTTDYAKSRGNNVLASIDLSNKNNELGTMALSSTPVPNLNFKDGVNYIKPTISDSNQQFALTNVFYWNNIVHDMTYQYGFTEAAGNFQLDNFSRGGQDSDEVFADVQDGYSMNNSNFSFTIDGSNPRMQMFLWLRPYYWPTLIGNSPGSISGFIYAQLSAISNIAEKPDITSNVVYYHNSGSGHNGCTTASNSAQLSGRIAFVDRGGCNFSVKVENAQNAGATAVIVGDTLPVNKSGLVAMSYQSRSDGSYVFDKTVTIPSVFLQTSDANNFRNLFNTNQTVNVTLSSINIDGSLDNAIIVHEYTHGISSRLTGGASNPNCLTNIEQGGEGISDYDALMLTTNWKTALLTDGNTKPRSLGNYVLGFDSTGPGIRTYPYSTEISINPWMYDSLATLPFAEPHLVGEIWCEMLWEMTWSIIQQVGSINTNFANASGTGGNSIAMNLFMEGLKLQPCNPTFMDARNAILRADTLLYGGAYSPAIWKAFAKRGLGYSANQGNPNVLTDNVGAHDVPSVLAAIFGNFTAEKQGNTALLKWSTAQESNTSRFIVERTTDAKTFTSIGEVKAAGNSAATQNYQLTDTRPVKGDNMYRVKEVDNDGKYNVSALRSLNFGDIKPYISISPNPATNIVTINIPGNDQSLHVRLFSNTGQSVNNYIMNNETLSINVSNLASGVYNIVIEGNGYSSKYKLVVQ